MSVRSTLILQQLVKVQLAQLGYKFPQLQQTTTLADGSEALYVNFTDGTPSTNDLAAFVILKSPTSFYPAALAAPSFHVGERLEGSVSGLVIMEAGASPMSALSKMSYDVSHALRGILGMPVEMKLTANGTLASVAGLLGAVADANIPASSMVLEVTNRAAEGGV